MRGDHAGNMSLLNGWQLILTKIPKLKRVLHLPQSFLGPRGSQDSTSGAGRAVTPRMAMRNSNAMRRLMSYMATAHRKYSFPKSVG